MVILSQQTLLTRRLVSPSSLYSIVILGYVLLHKDTILQQTSDI